MDKTSTADQASLAEPAEATSVPYGDGGPAFPRQGSSGTSPNGSYWSMPQSGMSLRDYFAAAAMQGVLQDRENIKAIRETADMEGAEWGAFLASRCYILADHMLKARS